MDPKSDFKTVHNGIKEFSKRIESAPNAPAGLLDTFTPIILSFCFLDIQSKSFTSILQFSRTDDKGLGATAQEFMNEISEKNPQVLTANIKELCKTLEDEAPTETKDNEPGTVATLKAYRKFIQTLVSYASYGTPPQASKYAITLLMTASDRKEMHAKDILEKSTKDWKYGEDHFLTKLAAISQLQLLSPKIADDFNDEILEITTPKNFFSKSEHQRKIMIQIGKTMMNWMKNVKLNVGIEDFGLIFKYAQTVKQARDAIHPDKSENLYVLSDLTQAIISKWEAKKGWTMQSYPAKIRVPAKLFGALQSHSIAQEIAEKNYLPERVDLELDKLIRGLDKKKKRKSIDESSLPASKKQKSESKSKSIGSKKERRIKTQKTKKIKEPRISTISDSERRKSGRGTSGRKSYVDRDDSEDEDECWKGLVNGNIMMKMVIGLNLKKRKKRKRRQREKRGRRKRQRGRQRRYQRRQGSKSSGKGKGKGKAKGKGKSKAKTPTKKSARTVVSEDEVEDEVQVEAEYEANVRSEAEADVEPEAEQEDIDMDDEPELEPELESEPEPNVESKAKKFLKATPAPTSTTINEDEIEQEDAVMEDIVSPPKRTSRSTKPLLEGKGKKVVSEVDEGNNQSPVDTVELTETLKDSHLQTSSPPIKTNSRNSRSTGRGRNVKGKKVISQEPEEEVQLKDNSLVEDGDTEMIDEPELQSEVEVEAEVDIEEPQTNGKKTLNTRGSTKSDLVVSTREALKPTRNTRGKVQDVEVETEVLEEESTPVSKKGRGKKVGQVKEVVGSGSGSGRTTRGRPSRG
ncbi:hypothetical protein DID88_009729 [Monilinia fructigena]|uniref:Uncharacterized protein n=1 Tax=Monilinia fructigena TaxID=38457 RepID=A0A395IMC9_9HELO|nr:hypothetical protein DID88_009729 [Monilinia fructigena]